LVLLSVRELFRGVIVAVVLTRDDVIGRADLPLTMHNLEEVGNEQASLPAVVEGTGAPDD
jgi:hypothetical protein